MEFIITTERLRFGIWKPEDIDNALELWGNKEVARYITAAGVFTEREIYEKLEREIETGKKFNIQYWPLYMKKENQFIGCCGLRPYDEDKNILETGVHIIPYYWKKGFAAEALKAVFYYAFNKLKINALFAGHNPHNKASAQMLLKIGFRYTHDEFYPPTGLNHPSYIFTKEDYLKRDRD